MKLYSPIKINEIGKHANKYIEVESIMSKVTQSLLLMVMNSETLHGCILH